VLQNFPNPFNASTEISLNLKTTGFVELDVYDLTGRHVRTLWRGEREVGSYEHIWNGLDDSGKALPTGQYLFRMISPDGKLVRKCLLLR